MPTNSHVSVKVSLKTYRLLQDLRKLTGASYRWLLDHAVEEYRRKWKRLKVR